MASDRAEIPSKLFQTTFPSTILGGLAPSTVDQDTGGYGGAATISRLRMILDERISCSPSRKCRAFHTQRRWSSKNCCNIDVSRQKC